MHWFYLALAILLEIAATTAMKMSDGYTKVLPTLLSLCGYIACFTLLAFALKKIEVGVAYAIWSGVGIAFITTIGIVFFQESLSVSKVVSILLIIVGVIGLNISGAAH